MIIDALRRVYESLHRILVDLTDEELHKEPHPSMDWLAWRLTRIMDSNVANLAGRKHLCIGEG